MTNMLELTQHDTVPALSITCTDNGEPVDLTGAESVKIVGAMEGQLLFNDTATGDVDGVVTRAWAAEDTDTAGTILAQVKVTWPGGGRQSFPPNGPLVVVLYPDLEPSA